jgi:hypothetical protein
MGCQRKSAMFDWRPISTAPFSHDLQLSVIEKGEVHALAFPCWRTVDGWVHAKTAKRVLVEHTHWRVWSD